MRCPNCSQENPEEMKFCSLCGSLLPVATQPVVTQPVTTQPVATQPERTMWLDVSEIEMTKILFCDGNFNTINSTLAETCKNELFQKLGEKYLVYKEETTIDKGIIEYRGGNDVGSPAIYEKNNIWEVVNATREIAKAHKLNLYFQIYSCFWTKDYDDNDSDGHNWYIFGTFDGQDYYVEESAINYFKDCEENDWNPIVFEEHSGETIMDDISERFLDDNEDYWTSEKLEKLKAIIRMLFTHPDAISADLY